MPTRLSHLTTGHYIEFDTDLEGGGSDLVYPFKSVVEQHSTSTHWARALEWCSGMGILGLDLLDRGAADHVDFLDSWAPAAASVQASAQSLGLESKVSTLTQDNIASVSTATQWDLVIANSPVDWINPWRLPYDELSPQDQNAYRILVDLDFAAHREFYAHIAQHLTPGGEVFIAQSHEDPQHVPAAQQGGLTFVGLHQETIPSNYNGQPGNPYYFYHFKLM